jgi:hypothetical protein
VRRQRSPRRRLLWLGGAVALVAAAIAATLILTGAPAVPDGGPKALTQARGIDTLLDSSTVGRGYLLTALDDIVACDRTALTGSTLSYIRAAEGARRSLLASAQQSVVSDLPDGSQIKTDLVAAVQASYDADKAYLAWVVASADHCPTHADPAWAPVVAANARADQAKQTFVDAWNPVARKYGLAQRSLTVI